MQVIKIGVSHPPTHSFSRALNRFGEDLEHESNGRYQVKVYSSSRVGSEKEMQEMLTIGTLEMTVTGVLNTYQPMFAVFELPYLLRDRQHVMAVNTGPIVDEVAQPLTRLGLRLIGFYENGFRHITNSKRPINTPEDVAGLLIRTPENPAQIETFAALGAVPTPLPFPELYTALLQGVVDGQENPLQNIWSGRIFEAQEHLALTGHIYNSAWVLVSEVFWQSLDPADQKLIKSCLDASSQWQLDLMEELDVQLEEDLAVAGMTITRPEKAAFVEATSPAYGALIERLGPEAEGIVRAIRETR